jgi:hypothetical protein
MMKHSYFYISNVWLIFVVGLLSLVTFGCGSSNTHGRLAMSSVDAAKPPSAVRGDYDSDDHYGPSHSDGDNDDNKPNDRDNDSDNSSGSYYDRDDRMVRDFGHAAGRLDRQEITAAVKRYYEAAAAGDGATACSMLVLGADRAVQQNLGRPPGPPYLRGGTCAVVMSKVFGDNHLQLTNYYAQLKVTGVRVSGAHGLAVLGFKTLPGREIRLRREGHMWRFDAVLDSELP